MLQSLSLTESRSSDSHDDSRQAHGQREKGYVRSPRGTSSRNDLKGIRLNSNDTSYGVITSRSSPLNCETPTSSLDSDTESNEREKEDVDDKPEVVIPSPIGHFWMRYIKPFHMTASALALLCNPDLWRYLTDGFSSPPNPSNVVTASARRIDNADTPITVLLLLCAVTFPSFCECIVLFTFKKRASIDPFWFKVFIESLVMACVTSFMVVSGQDALTGMIGLVLKNGTLAPLFIYPNWQSWEEGLGIWGMAFWVVGGFLFQVTVVSWFFVYIWITPEVEEHWGSLKYVFTFIVMFVLFTCIQEIFVILSVLEDKDMLQFGDEKEIPEEVGKKLSPSSARLSISSDDGNSFDEFDEERPFP